MSEPLLLSQLSSAQKNLKLGKDEVHVWRTSLDLDTMQVQNLMRYLSRDEQARAQKYRFQIDRKYYIAARGILREIISIYLKKDPAQIVFKYNDFGKPFLTGQEAADELYFNLSHSRGVALYAFTQGRKVGIDLEYIRSDLVEDYTAEQTFSAREVEILRSLPKEVQVRAFFNCWTRKEAYIKAKGLGLSIPLDQFDVSLSPGDPARLLNTEWDEDEASLWSLHELNVSSEYAATLAVEGRGLRIKYYEWPRR